MEHEGEIVKGEPEIRLRQLTVKANMSSQSLQALLTPLTVGKVTLLQCVIMEEGKENNNFTKPGKVVLYPIIIYYYFYRPQKARTRILNHVSGEMCHHIHLTILRRFSWPSLALMYTKVI